MAEVILPCGRMLLIDDADVHLLMGRRWYSEKRGNVIYARGRIARERTGGVYLHRLITGVSGVDHRDGNGLDNRRLNLRICTQAQNCLNAGKKRPHKKFKGVYFDARRNKWWAQLYVARHSFFGGYHDTEEGAAAAYDMLAIQHHREFARLNRVHRGPAT